VFGQETLRPGVKSGEMCIREVAAYIIDHGHYLGVPKTALVETYHPNFKIDPFYGLDVTSDFYKQKVTHLLDPVHREIKFSSFSGCTEKESSHLTGKESAKVRDESLTERLGRKVGSL